MSDILDSETIHTAAGDYEIHWRDDHNPDQPFDDVFGYQLFDPAGRIVDECWGFYGEYWDEKPDSERSHTLREATEAALLDAENRARAVNLVGAGFVGVI